MISIPIFDSLTHPTINGKWIHDNFDADIENLISQFKQNNVIGAFGVGMKDIGNYNQTSFYKLLKNYSTFLIPIAYFDFSSDLTLKSIKKELNTIKKIGFKGIKLHPRFSNFNIKSDKLANVIKLANDLGLTVLLCTYLYGQQESACTNSIDDINTILHQTSNAELILLHSGSVRFLEMIELGRAYKNILLDLSFTLCKYEGSSLDLDIQFAFNTFDERICVGSDHPQFSIKKLRTRFDYFSKELAINKAENIGYKNIKRYIKTI